MLVCHARNKIQSLCIQNFLARIRLYFFSAHGKNPAAIEPDRAAVKMKILTVNICTPNNHIDTSSGEPVASPRIQDGSDRILAAMIRAAIRLISS